MSKENKPPEKGGNVFKHASSLPERQRITFSGLLDDPHLQTIMAIDRFTQSLYQCKVFLLSHHHWDHMDGLKQFVEVLNLSTDKFVYCSPLTREFLSKPSYGINPEKLISLDVNRPMNVYQLENSFVVVTALPAAHCPGSVMFLIEYNDKKILYTGDFRMNLNFFKKSLKCLLNADGTFKGIDDLYLDSTFALPSACNNFPLREDSEKLIIDLIETWFLRSTDTNSRKVIIQIPACIGSESIFMVLAKKFKTKIFVHDDNYNHFYKGVEGLNSCIEPVNDIVNGENWSIHACRGFSCIKSLKTKKDLQFRVIKPCALSFVRGDDNPSVIKSKYGVPFTIVEEQPDYSFVKVLYSSHSSLQELIEIVNFIQPKKIFYNTSYKNFHDVMKQSFMKEKICEKNDPKEKYVQVKPSISTDNECVNHEKKREHVAKKLKLFL